MVVWGGGGEWEDEDEDGGGVSGGIREGGEWVGWLGIGRGGWGFRELRLRG